MITRNYGENTTAECRHDSNEATKKQKRYLQILTILRSSIEPLTSFEIAMILFKNGFVDRIDRNYVSPRMTEMCQIGITEPVGKKYCSVTGRFVTAYQIREAV